MMQLVGVGAIRFPELWDRAKVRRGGLLSLPPLTLNQGDTSGIYQHGLLLNSWSSKIKMGIIPCSSCLPGSLVGRDGWCSIPVIE